MTATRPEASERQVSENVTILMHRAGIKQRPLALAVGINHATLNRRMLGTMSWLLWEVEALADYFRVTLEEITTDLPSREDWQVRWDDVRLQGFEPRTF